jgi:hypothetical protein
VGARLEVARAARLLGLTSTRAAREDALAGPRADTGPARRPGTGFDAGAAV